MIVPVLFFAAVAADWSGTWVYRVQSHPFFVLTFDDAGGSFTRPKKFQMNGEGDVSNVSPETVREPVTWTQRGREFRAGDDRYVITVVDATHATLAYAEAAWMAIPLDRARPSEDLAIPSPWPEPQYPPEIVDLQKQLKAMVQLDQEARLAKPFDARRALEIDRNHRPEIERIFAKYGWPKWSVVGKAAAGDFWLLVQHQDEAPDLQRRALDALERAVAEDEASRSHYAYLYDRVHTGEGKPQRWGTQAKCVNGLPVLSPVDDPAGLDARRRELHMPPVKEYLKGLGQMCRGSK